VSWAADDGGAGEKEKQQIRGGRRRRGLGMLLLGSGGGTGLRMPQYRVQLVKFPVEYEWHLNSTGLLAKG
jgi:hypothetical protein